MIRIFKVGIRKITAPIPNGTLQQNVEHLAKSFPQFRWTTVFDTDGVIQPDGSIMYELQLPPKKSNG